MFFSATGTKEKKPLKNRSIRLFLGIIWVMLFVALVLQALPFFCVKNQDTPACQVLSQWQMDGEPIFLPSSLHGLSSREPVTLTAQLEAAAGDYLYFKTVYAPVEVFADGNLIFSYGQPGTFADFWLDPPTKVALFPLPFTEGDITLTIRYYFPSQRSTLALHPVLCGTYLAIREHLLSEMGFSLFFSIILIILGIILCLVSLILTRFEPTGISFCWLGLFALCTGMWILGECNLTGLYIQNSILLYVMAFGGMFTLCVPLLKFFQVVLDLFNNKWLNGMLLTFHISICAAFLLQLTGTVALCKTLYVFHVIIPLFLCLICCLVLPEAIGQKNTAATRLLPPIIILTLFALLEVGNYYLHFLNSQKSFFFQVGVLFFILALSIVGGYFIGDMFMLRTKNRQLSYELFLMEKQVEMQNERHRLLSETSVQLRQQRHDLKHHLAVIGNYLNNREFEKTEQYLDELSSKIPSEPLKRICINDAVNAVALYYQTAAREAGVTSLSILLDIPKDTGHVPESDLCVIIGNLLENAVAACRDAKEPFIRMCSRFSNGVLTITMDNSFSYVTMTPDHGFLSSKPGGGIGLSSIRSIAEKHHGTCRFEVKDKVFCSSVYLRLL